MIDRFYRVTYNEVSRSVKAFMKFVKMQGIGNDYVFIDCFNEPMPENPERLAVEMSRPHTGIGADGLIILSPDAVADARMLMYNKDGSAGGMCGNGIRCAGKYLYDTGLTRKRRLTIAAAGGAHEIELRFTGERVTDARVDMGEPRFEPELIPLNADGCEALITFPDGEKAKFTCLSMGNPHAVTLDRFPEGDDFYKDGAFVETHALFPKRVNACFLKVEGDCSLVARVWERGSGPTLACGSGACAALVAAAKVGACGRKAKVKLPGGELYIEWDAGTNRVFMLGPADTCFTGEWDR